MKDTNEKLISLYKPRWKGTEAQLRKALERETYYTAAEAVEWGLADYISDAVRPAAYDVVTGTRKTPGLAIAASEANHKFFTRRQAALRLWEIELDAMRRELAD